jgi:hypothetical protein
MRGANAQIVRPKIVPPLRDAVRLVDRDQIELGAREEIDERFRREPLRCHVDEPVRALEEPGLAPPALL